MANGDDLETVQHPTLGALKFPKDMSPAERKESIDYVIRQKYGLPEGTDLHQKNPPKGVDLSKYSNAYYEASGELPTGEGFGEKIAGAAKETYKQLAPVAKKIGGKVLDVTGLREGALFGGEGYAGAMAPRTIEQALSPAEMAAGEAVGGAIGEIPAVKRGLGKVFGRAAEEAPAAERPAAAAAIAPVERVPPPAYRGPGFPAHEAPAPAPRSPIPSTQEALDATAQMRYRKPYEDLTFDQQREIIQGVGRGQEAPLVPEQRVGERRAAAPTPATIPPVERRVGERRLTPQSTEAEIQAEAQRQVQEMGQPQTPLFEDFRARRRAEIDADIAQHQREQTGVPQAPPAQQITPVRKPPPQPGIPERPPPVEGETDPIKREFPDPAIRQIVRVNGAEIVRAFGDDREALQAVHNLTNVQVREAAINAGIDLGTKHVGTKIGLGPEQVSRQDLIDQLVRKGLRPEDIVDFAQPIRKPGTELPARPRGSPFGEPETKGIRGGKGLVAEGMRAPAPMGITEIPAELLDRLRPDEIEFLKGRKVLQRNVVAAYRALKPKLDEIINAARAGEGLAGWWQRFMDTFEAMGAPIEGAEKVGINHVENLKAFHGALSGNKEVEHANRLAWGAYRDWLEQGRPTDRASIDAIIRRNGAARAIPGEVSGVAAISDTINNTGKVFRVINKQTGEVLRRVPPGGTIYEGLDTTKLWKLVNSPQLKEGLPFTSEAFVRSPVAGTSPGSQKIPSMVGTTAGKGNLDRVVFDTHMKDLYGLNDLTDAQYIAASIHIREAGAMMGLTAGEAQEQMWGTVLGLKSLFDRGMNPKQAAAKYGRDVLASIGKDYAEIIQESLKTDPEMRQIMEDLKKFGFDPGGPVATKKLEAIVRSGQTQMSKPLPRLSRDLLQRTATRIYRGGSWP